MVKIKINPKFFKDYDEETKQSKTANNMFLFVGPSSVSFEKALVPWNCGKYEERNKRVLKEKTGCANGTAPVWATVEGMWFSDEEFPLIAASEVYPNLILGVSTGKIIVEKDGTPLTVDELTEMSGGSSGGGSLPKDGTVLMVDERS
jgi:hypothetical protein